ncbi:sigma-70 family RNA polymerase sigma factor [Streptomyces sp. NBC_01537]|uniref:sigma-70 family RNA polymerase sigma factor n=1 Tax=Streptomyces sp. NBC_01537 TaxID=2903896 RepID=UPI0038664671
MGRDARRPSAATVEAARAGRRDAMDTLLAESLPLVHNVVGRALHGRADADETVEEAMLHIEHGLDTLHDPAAFHGWLAAIAMRQVRDRWRARQDLPLFALADEAGSDFVDLTILCLGLSGQRAELARATRWLEPEDRDVLSLWWLETTGELTRTELAAACGLTSQHATVRVQRMKARLDAARSVVRALSAVPGCPLLMDLVRHWDRQPAPHWRKRVARHTRECPLCERQWHDMRSVEGLLVGLGLVPPPAEFTERFSLRRRPQLSPQP